MFFFKILEFGIFFSSENIINLMYVCITQEHFF